MSEDINWIEQCIKEKHIKHHEYKKFSNIIKIGNGSFGPVYRANLKRSVFALKSFNVVDNSILNEIISELKLHREVDFHDNIIRFHGITTITTQTDSGHLKEYLLVLEYADEGTLRNYLEKKFSTLNWEDKYRLAYQLSSAVELLHDEGVVHRDLHSKSVLIHQGKIKLADFGLSKRIEDTTELGSNIFGVIPYMDPKGFSIVKKKKDTLEEKDREKYKKSDVYSVGVLFWELSSGKSPFDEFEYDVPLVTEIIKGLRESKVKDTPEEYYNLYTKCWDGDPDKRPTIQEVVATLDSMIKLQQNSILLNKQQSQQDSDSGNSYASITTSMISQISDKLKQDGIPLNEQQPHQNSNLTSSFDEQEFDFIGEFGGQFGSKINGIFVKELVELFIGWINEGKSYSLFHSILEEYLSLHKTTLEEIYKWLNNNYTTDLDFTFFIGYLNFSGIGTALNFNNAFYYFNEASSWPIAQYYLGICYEMGIGVKKDLQLSFEWYKKSAEETTAGRHSLALLYEKSGVEQNVKLAFDLYHEAANNGHIIAQHYLGNCYRLEIRVKKDYKKAFYYFSLSAQEGYASSIIKLGDCYLKGIGTDVDEKKAFDLYLKAAGMNEVIAPYSVTITEDFNKTSGWAEKDYIELMHQLGYCYQYGIGTEKNEIKAFELYKELVEKGYIDSINNLGYCYQHGIGTERNETKAFELYKQAAEKGHIKSINNLGYCYQYGISTEKNEIKAFELYQKAAEKNNIESINNLGYCYQYGIGTEKNEIKAFELYKELVEKGHIKSMNNLGYCYQHGIGTGKNEIKAFELYEEAAEEGHIESICNLGCCYEYGTGTEKNEIKAFELYIRAAEKGQIDSMNNLGDCFQYGIGTEKNETIAFELYKRAAEKGHIQSMHNLRYCYQHGIGTEKNEIKAFELYSSTTINSYITTINNSASNEIAGILSQRSSISKIKSPPTKSITDNQQVVQQLKLNHGLFLDGYSIQPSKRAIFMQDGELCISLYNGQPIVYTSINNPSSTNLLNINSDKDNFDKTLQPSDVCINFPIGEVTYKGDLLESFSKHMDDDELYKLYGHLFARKTLIGGKIFIKKLNLATSLQIDLFKSHIAWAYNSAKYNTENPIDGLPISDFSSRIVTLDGEQLSTPKKLANWLNDLYQKDMFDIISYDDLITVSQLKINPLSEKNSEALIERQPGVSNFEKKLSLKEWIGDAVYVNLVRWIKDFHLLQGLIINKFYKMEKLLLISPIYLR